MIRVLVVDDSAFMRKALSLMIEQQPDMTVVGTARDGHDGYEQTLALKPDVVTLDIDMPRMDGIEAIGLIMDQAPTPILVVSSLTTHGAKLTLDALELGAVDYVPKSQSYVALDILEIEDELIEKIKLVASTKGTISARSGGKPNPGVTPKGSRSAVSAAKIESDGISCIAIGVSTGGPPLVQRLLQDLPADFPCPILIAQHMPREFTGSFASRLDSASRIRVKEAENGEILVPGVAYVAVGGKHLIVRKRGVDVQIGIKDEPANLLYHPSADVLFRSVAAIYGENALGIILTGMGRDGVKGLKELKSAGGKVYAQDRSSSVVYGMPKAAVEAGVVHKVLNIEGLIRAMSRISEKERVLYG